MNLDLKFYTVCVLILVVVNIASASRRKTPKRRRTPRPGTRVRAHQHEHEDDYANFTISTIESTTTEAPIEFPYGMLCVSRKLHRSMALKATEDCCHKVGVPCKQTDHIGQPFHERNCVTENRQEFRNMKTCCRRKKKTWKKGHVEDGIDCNHRLENVTEITTELPTTLETTTKIILTTTTTITTTTTRPTTRKTTTPKPHPKPHPKTSRPHHVTSKPHHHLATTTTHPTTTTTTATTTKPPTTTKKKKMGRRLDKKVKVLKLD